MEYLQSEYLIIFLVFIAFVAGLVDSVSGGGGLLLLPSLMICNIPPHYAMGTNKFISIFGGGSAFFMFLRHKKIIIPLALLGGIFAIFGSVLGTKSILLLDSKIVMQVIIFILPAMLFLTFLPKKKIDTSLSARQIYIYSPIISFLIGFYDGFIGPGTGTFLILAFYVFFRLDLVFASGVAKAINLSSGVASCVVFIINAKVLFAFAIPLVVANMLGGIIGGKIAVLGGARIVKFFMISSFGLIFITLLVRYFK